MQNWKNRLWTMTCFLCMLLCCSYGNRQTERPLKDVSSKEALRYLTERMSDMATFQHNLLNPMLVERVSGTPANARVRQHIISHMQNLGWTVVEDRFENDTPLGRKAFVNIVATLNPGPGARSVLACHYDSKDMGSHSGQDVGSQGGRFLGATDSAVPCAVLLDTATQLDCLLTKATTRVDPHPASDLTLQYVFFDGEEAFKRWTDTDSIYGARHLANRWKESGQLSSIREFILLDLIGHSRTHFVDLFPATSSLYQYLADTEQRLRKENLLSDGHTATLFSTAKSFQGIEDDHIPFLRNGVDILHLISWPFPPVWHKVEDDGSHLDLSMIDNFSRIFRVFVSGLMHLQPENNACR